MEPVLLAKLSSKSLKRFLISAENLLQIVTIHNSFETIRIT